MRMLENNEKSVKLAGGLEHTTTWIKITGDGDIIVDYYDFSDESQNSFGKDIAYLLTIKGLEKATILRLLSDDTAMVLSGLSTDDLMLKLMQSKFSNYSTFA
jgi:hypothetical protein